MNRTVCIRAIWTKIWSYKIAWASFSFALALMLFEELFFVIEFHWYLVFVFVEIENASETFIRAGIQLFLVFIVTTWFVWAALASRPVFKMFYFCIFTGIIFIEYGYQYATDNYLALQDIYTAFASWQTWDEAIINYVNWLALIPMISFAALLWLFRAAGVYGLKLLLAIIVATMGLNIAALYYANFDATEQLLKVYSTGPSISMPSFFRVVTYLGLEQLTLAQFSRQTVSFQADTQPDNNIVFILDESVRYDHLSVNGYERPTTPFLQQLEMEGLLYNWGLAVSGSTCSRHSGAMLLTGFNDLPDKSYALRQWPSIFQYAKAMNYTTHYIDGEADALRFPLTADDLLYIDNLMFQEKFGMDYDSDLRIADWTAAILSESTGNFIFIFKRGSHFPYSATFPNEQALWTPILGSKVIISDDQERVVNSYDNAIYHNINNFFQRLLENRQVLSSTTILYTSDHAQNLGEAKNQLIHCGKTRYEASVPLFLITSYPLKIDTTFKAAHRNLFAALLDFINFPEAERTQPYSLSLLNASDVDSGPRRFFIGSVFGLGEYTWVYFD